MADSSPGNHRILDPSSESPNACSAGNPATHGTDQDSRIPPVPFDEQGPACSAQPSSGKTGPSQQSTVCYAIDDASPLKKPSVKPPDFDKGYTLAPAMPFAPGQFTRRLVNPAPLHQADQPHQTPNRSPPCTSRDPKLRSYFPTQDSEPAESAVGGESVASGLSNRSLGKLVIASQPPAETGIDRSHKATAPKGSQPLGQPPFQNSSPNCAARLPFQIGDTQIKIGCSFNPSARPTLDQTSVIPPANVNEHMGNPDPNIGHAAQHSSQGVASDHQFFECSQHAHFGETEKGKEASRGPHAPLPSADSRNSAWHATYRSQAPMVNRPLRDMAQERQSKPTHQLRPDSRGSNVSKTRLGSNSSHRVVRDLDRMERAGSGSLTSSPMSQQRRLNISHEFTTGMAGVINEFTQQQNAALREQKARYHKYIKRLQRDLAERSEVIAQQISQIDAQREEVKDLQASEERLNGKVKDMEAKLTASEDRVRRLEEKYHIYRTHLNSAIQEQQDLYTLSKKQCQEAIDHVRTIEKAQKAEAEMAVRKAEVIREQMTEKIRQAITQNKSEASDCKHPGLAREQQTTDIFT